MLTACGGEEPIFVVISGEGNDLHISICIRASHCFVSVCTCAVSRSLRRIGQSSTRRLSFRPSFTCLLACDCGSRDRRCVRTVSAIFGHFLSQTLSTKDRQCCEVWREVELGVHAVCAVSDTTDEDRESICCAVRHTVTLTRAVWQTIHLPQLVRVLGATTTDAGRHRPSAALTTTPAVRSISVVYHSMRQLQPLATTFGDILHFCVFYYVKNLFCSVLQLFIFPPRHWDIIIYCTCY